MSDPDRAPASAGPETARSGPAHAYRVYGGRLVSDVELAGLPEDDGADGPADWTLRRIPGPPLEDEGELLARQELMAGVELRLLEAGEDLRLAFDDTGTFDVSPDGSRIDWRPGPRVTADHLRSDVAGRALPLALHRRGVLTLHASAARLEGGAVAFAGPKGAGKTTAAYGLGALGATVLADDAVPVAPGEPPRILPGLHRLRLRSDVARATGHGPEAAVTEDGRVEAELTPPPRRARPVPLLALYLLSPVDEDARPGVRRERLEGRRAALAVLGQVKLGTLLARWRGGDLLRACAELAERVPVYRLEVARDLERLEETAQFVAGAHGGHGRAGAAG